MGRRGALLLLALALLSGTHAAAADEPDVYRRLARTINVDTRDLWPEARHLDAIRDAGFTAVRLALSWTKHAGAEPPYAIDPEYMRQVERSVREARARGLAVILDYHVDKQLMADPAAWRGRWLALWEQIAEHFSAAGPDVLFEPMAEPCGRLDEVWNRCLPQALAVIRRSNPRRTVIVGPAFYNSLQALDALEVPPDPFLVVCVHYYNPVRFTLQGQDNVPGADGWLGTRWTGTDAERAAVRADFDAMARWSRTHGRPLYVEELGVTERADAASRALWIACVRREAEARGMPWGIWAFAPTFSIYDLQKGRWDPDLLKALIPGSRPSERP